MTRPLTLYEAYSREEVHDIFSHETRFTSSSGTWGLWGIVQISNKPGDIVLFVTFGQEQAGHKFDEWITENGVISWQSQPSQSLDNTQIQKFIRHDPTLNNIYLFLRTKKREPYTYLGRLGYYSHDLQRERPVYIQWQILDWPPPKDILKRMELNLISGLQPDVSEQKTLFNIQNAENGQDSFKWLGKRYQVQLEKLIENIKLYSENGFPTEALRFQDWYVELAEHRVSAKWVFHLITGAGYNQFDAPTARLKLAQIGIKSYKVSVHPKAQSISETSEFEYKDGIMPGLRYTTINGYRQLFTELYAVGEIPRPSGYSNRYGLNDYHYIEVLASGLAIITPYSFIGTPRLFNMMPGDSGNVPNSLQTNNWDYFAGGFFNANIFKRYPEINQDYATVPKTQTIYEDEIWRPVLLYDYLKQQEDWEDWTFSALTALDRVFNEPKKFVHSTLPIENLHGGLQACQDAIWNHPLYWLALQFVILSDTTTGATYDPKIHLSFPTRYTDGGKIQVFLGEEYVGELNDILQKLLPVFRWVWINPDEQKLLNLFRLLYKINVFELEYDGRGVFTSDFRKTLFENNTKYSLQYRNSKDARQKIREIIKDSSR